jgi:hypothetical protein
VYLLPRFLDPPCSITKNADDEILLPLTTPKCQIQIEVTLKISETKSRRRNKSDYERPSYADITQRGCNDSFAMNVRSEKGKMARLDQKSQKPSKSSHAGSNTISVEPHSCTGKLNDT